MILFPILSRQAPFASRFQWMQDFEHILAPYESHSAASVFPILVCPSTILSPILSRQVPFASKFPWMQYLLHIPSPFESHFTASGFPILVCY